MRHFRFPDLFFKITLLPILFQKLPCVSLTSQFRERKSQDIKKKRMNLRQVRKKSLILG